AACVVYAAYYSTCESADSPRDRGMRIVGPACESGRRDRDISRARLFAGLVEEPFGRASPATAAGAGRHAGPADGDPEWMQLDGCVRARLAAGHHDRGRLEPAALDRRGDRVFG